MTVSTSLFVLLAVISIVAPSLCCSPGFEAPYGGKCYKFVKGTTNWLQASHNCRSQGAFLVSIETIGEQRHLESYINSRPHLKYPGGFNTVWYWGYWTSGTDAAAEGTWMWNSTGRPVTYKKFAHGLPDNAGGGEHCLQLLQAAWYWNDVHCHAALSYICEK